MMRSFPAAFATALSIPLNAAFLGALVGYAEPAPAQSGNPARPNILLIAVDDLRPQTSAYGFERMKTPALDRIGAEGMRFGKAYCNVPVCGASRASLLTGIRPLPDRFVIADTWAEKDAPGAVSLPQVFKASGYHTLSYGKVFHHKEDLETQSWSEPAWKPAQDVQSALDPESAKFRSADGRGPIWEAPDVPDHAYPDGMMAERVIQDLDRVSKLGKPFFMAVGFFKPHLPFYAPKKYWDLYPPGDVELAGNRYPPRQAPGALNGSGEFKSYHLRGMAVNSDEFHRTMRRGYYASVSYADAQIAKVLAQLEAKGLKDNTLVILWGDHGWHLGEHDFWGKHNLLDNATRVPLLLNGPGIGKGKVLNQLVESVDLFPTLLEYAGIAPDPKVKSQLEGSTFMPLIRNPDQPGKKAVFLRFKEGSTMVTDRYAFTTYGGASQMLYDHQKDPGENQNVAGQAAYASVLDSLKKMHADGWTKFRSIPTSLPGGSEDAPIPGAGPGGKPSGTPSYRIAHGILTVTGKVGQDGQPGIRVFSLAGREMAVQEIAKDRYLINGALSPGVYLVRVGGKSIPIHSFRP